MVARRTDREARNTAQMHTKAIVPSEGFPVFRSAIASFPRLFRVPRPHRGSFITLLRSLAAPVSASRLYALIQGRPQSRFLSLRTGRPSFSILTFDDGRRWGPDLEQAPGRPHTRFSITGVSAEGFRPRGTDAPDAEALAPHRRRAA